VDLVEVYVTVLNASNQAVSGLTADDFRVAEDGRPQAIAAFAAGDVPLGVAIAVDHSFSVSARQLSQIVTGAERFLGALAAGDEVMVMGIGSQTALLTGLSTDRQPAVAALRRLEPWGTTPLYDAVVEAIAHVDASSGRRALVLLTDGVDRYSRTNATAMIEEARGRNVLVYPVIVGRAESPTLSAVARITGGRAVLVREPQRLGDALVQVATELRAQYLTGYTPQAARPEQPTWRTIRVSVARPGLSVRAREGYLAR
jgi:Ca-activated chloride channel family protein